MTPIDLRSDTVTLPTAAMREAMATAEVGDDVFGEDPTVVRLERAAAERVGKEAALFVPSGTMANLAALLTHCERGRAVICGDRSHIFRSEVGGAAALGGLVYHTVRNREDGTLDGDELPYAFTGVDNHQPHTGLVCLENTHNYCAGAVLTPETTEAAARVAHERGVPVHLDGARIFNAAIALDIDVRRLTASVDTVSFCLSKGLSAPAGSLLCGSEEFIARARRTRKMLGGGMRQAGVLAAAGIVALETMVERLADDHEHARILAHGLATLPGLEPLPVATNIVIAHIRTMDARAFVAALRERGVLCMTFGPQRVRFVTHFGIDRRDIKQALEAARDAIGLAA